MVTQQAPNARNLANSRADILAVRARLTSQRHR